MINKKPEKENQLEDQQRESRIKPKLKKGKNRLDRKTKNAKYN